MNAMNRRALMEETQAEYIARMMGGTAYWCMECGQAVLLHAANDIRTRCPNCGGTDRKSPNQPTMDEVRRYVREMKEWRANRAAISPAEPKRGLWAGFVEWWRKR